MPPTSRGLLLFRVIRRHASTLSANSPTAVASQSSLVSPTRLPPTKLYQKTPSKPVESILPHAEAPSPAQPSAHPQPLLQRLISRLSSSIPPAVRRPLRVVFRALPYLPPLMLMHLHFPYSIMWVNGPSMSPLLNTNYSTETPNTEDRVLIQKHENMFQQKPKLQRGMIVIFRTPHDPEKVAVKRIVALAGDRVQPLPGYGSDLDSVNSDTRVVVPYNHVWVEGDSISGSAAAADRSTSIDSNWYGPISQRLVLGHLLAVLTPWYAPSLVHWEQHLDYPARTAKRVEIDAVRSATWSPDTSAQRAIFEDDTAGAELVLSLLNIQPHGSRPGADDVTATTPAAAGATATNSDDQATELASLRKRLGVTDPDKRQQLLGYLAVAARVAREDASSSSGDLDDADARRRRQHQAADVVKRLSDVLDVDVLEKTSPGPGGNNSSALELAERSRRRRKMLADNSSEKLP